MFAVTLFVFLCSSVEAFASTEWDFGSTGSVQNFVVPNTGEYRIEVWGSQGGSNGGRGGYVSTKVTLLKGSELNMYVGNTSGYNGGGAGSAYGGGATDVRLNGTALTDRLVSAAGGGGGSGGTAGGTGNGSGGSSVGSGAGTAGVNGGGGGRSYNHTYTTSGYWQDNGGSYQTTPGYWTTRQRMVYGTKPGCSPLPHQPSEICDWDYWVTEDVWVPGTTTWVPNPQTWVSGSTYTTSGSPGNGGSNFVKSGVTVESNQSGINTSNGRVKITQLVMPPEITFGSLGSEYKRSLDVTFSLAKGTNDVSHYFLPDGTRVDGSFTGTFNVTANGTYTVRAVDVLGFESTKSIVVDRIDLEAPTGDIGLVSSAWTNGDVTIRLSNLVDSKSGLDKIILPNNSEVSLGTDTSFNYVASENGTYTFGVVDKLGNVLTRSIVVSNIDRTPPTISISSRNGSWSSSAVIGDVGISDISGVALREFAFVPRGSTPLVYASLTGTTVTSPATTGDYVLYVRARDGAGNTFVMSGDGFKVDRDLPTFTTSLSTTGWTNQDVEINVNGIADVHSGVASVVVTGPNSYSRSLAVGTSGKAAVSENGTYTVTVRDVVGNVRTSSVVVDKIDKNAPNSPTITLDSLEWSKVGLGFTLVDRGDVGLVSERSGVARMEYSFDQVSWTTYTTGSKIPDDRKGLVTLYARAVDVAGNTSTVVSAVAKIDDTAPVFDLAEVREIGGKPNVFVNAVDIHSGLATSPYRFEKRVEGVSGFASLRNWGLLPNVEITEDVPNALYVFRAYARDLNNNEGVSNEVGYVSAPIVSDELDSKKSNKVTFTLDRSIGLADGVEVEVYRSGKLVGKLASGDTYVDDNLGYERTYDYRFVTVATFGGQVLKSKPFEVTIETGVPEASLELVGDTIKRTVFTDTVRIKGNMMFQSGGIFDVVVKDDVKNVVARSKVDVDPFVKAPMEIEVDMSKVRGNNIYLSFLKEGLADVGVDQVVEVVEAEFIYEGLSNDALEQVYK